MSPYIFRPLSRPQMKHVVETVPNKVKEYIPGNQTDIKIKVVIKIQEQEGGDKVSIVSRGKI